MATEKKEEITAGMENEAPVEQTSLRKYREKVKARYPDTNPQSDEEWADLEDRYAEDVEGEISKYKDSDMTLQEVMTAYPELAMILYDIVVNKIPVRVAIIKNLSQEDLIPAEGDPDYPDYDSVLKEQKSKKEKQSSIDAEIEANELASIANLDKVAADKGLSDEQKDALLEFANNAFSEIMMKNIPESIWDAFHKAMSYDKDVEMAKQEGELKGRNTAIELKKAAAEQKMDDGIPAIGKGSGVQEAKPSRAQEIFKGVGERKGI